MFGIMIGVGPKFYSAPPPVHVFDYRSRSQTLTFHVKVFVKFLRFLYLFGMMIDIGPKVYSVPPRPVRVTCRSRSQILMFGEAMC